MSRIRVIELCGQSNAVGRNLITTELPSGYSGDLEIRAWDGADFTRVNMSDYESAAWNFDGSTNTNNFGPQPFMLDLSQQLRDGKAWFAPLAEGGTSLATDWNPASGATYTSWQSQVRLIRDWFANIGVQFSVTHRLWIQGEADAQVEADANAYQTNLDEFLTESNDFYYGIQGLEPHTMIVPLTTGADSGTLTYRDTVIAAQEAVAGSRDDCTLVDMTGAAYTDGVHYDVSTYQNIIMPALFNKISEDYLLNKSF